jgi:hypothetical protein
LFQGCGDFLSHRVIGNLQWNTTVSFDNNHRVVVLKCMQ